MSEMRGFLRWEIGIMIMEDVNSLGISTFMKSVLVFKFD